jgi:cobalt-zinc-cadmium efflux system membrane fusion protein
MTAKSISLFVALALLPACSQQSPPHSPDEHAGHDHAPTESDGKMCPEHNVLVMECGICKPQLIPGLNPGESLKVRLAAGDSTAIAGIRTAAPDFGSIGEGVECYAELAFNQNKLARIAAPVSGILQEISADLGGKIEEKQTVAKIWSASIAEAVAKAVLSHQTLERERKLRAGRVTSEKDLQQAEADHRAACQPLRTFGVTEEQIDSLGDKPQESVLMEVRAPFAGEIVERAAVRGDLVETGRTLFTLADRSVMWAMLAIPETSLTPLRPGQTVELKIEALPGQVFSGKLAWIGAEVDERSRMIQARAEIPNPDGLLKSKMFASARIIVARSEEALLLPASAIQKIEGKPFIFVKLEEDLFAARVVRLGARENGRIQILEGLKRDETVVIDHGFSLKSALLISRLGAGCADD